MNNQYPWMLVVSAAILLSSCASNDELFTKYDKTCDLPAAKVKVVEKVKYTEKVVYKDKIVYKDKNVAVEGMPWEPAVYFGFDLDSLNSKEAQRLATDVAILNKAPTLKVNVQSFTDSKGSSAYNKRLALRRQATVVDYLTTMGVVRSRITVSPLGEELPLLGQSEQEQAVNRRVELMLLDQTGKPLALNLHQK